MRGIWIATVLMGCAATSNQFDENCTKMSFEDAPDALVRTFSNSLFVSDGSGNSFKAMQDHLTLFDVLFFDCQRVYIVESIPLEGTLGWHVKHYYSKETLELVHSSAR